MKAEKVNMIAKCVHMWSKNTKSGHMWADNTKFQIIIFDNDHFPVPGAHLAEGGGGQVEWHCHQVIIAKSNIVEIILSSALDSLL